MRSKILFIASLLVVTLGITSCNQQRKQQKATTETATATSLTTQSFTDVVGNKLDLTFDSEKNSATIHFGGETAELAGQVTASGYCYKNEHYELLGKGNDVQLLKDGQVVFAHEDEKVEIEAKKDHEFDNGSAILLPAVDEKLIGELKTLGLIWGFLKYYHPEVAKGEVNWDYELFRVIPRLLKANGKKERDAVYVQWIHDLGDFGEGTEPEGKASEIKMLPDLDWIETAGFSRELTDLLNKVRAAKRPSAHYYIGLHPFVGNPDFKNEEAYNSMEYPDAGFRLLALYRYWNIIQYYFPYKYLIQEDWKNVLQEFIPKFIGAGDATAYTLAVLEIIGRIHDTHANIWGGNKNLTRHYGARYAAPILNFIEDKAVVTGFYDAAFGKESGLERGDMVTAVNRTPVETLIKDRMKHYPASNRAACLRDMAGGLLRTNDSTIEVTLSRGNRSDRKTLKTYSYEKMRPYRKDSESDTCFKFIRDDIAYLYLGSIKKDDLPDIFDEVENTKGLIVDLRCYPSDFVVFDMGRYMYPEPTAFVKFTHGSLEQAGLFSFSNSINVGQKYKDYYAGKVVILINETTQSQAEYTAMAFRQAPRAVVVGSTTAGADGNVSFFFLPGGIRTAISGIGVYYPDGTETQRIGIVPDVEIRPTVRGIKEGRDEVLEKAIALIDEP